MLIVINMENWVQLYVCVCARGGVYMLDPLPMNLRQSKLFHLRGTILGLFCPSKYQQLPLSSHH